jgi:hypothetical protein
MIVRNTRMPPERDNGTHTEFIKCAYGCPVCFCGRLFSNLFSSLSVEYILSDPICCGFLLKFSESQYNSENVHFIMVVAAFKETILASDSTTWPLKQWRKLDERYLDPLRTSPQSSPGSSAIDGVEPEKKPQKSGAPVFDVNTTPWPSCLNKLVMQTQVQRIWDTYLR